MKTTVKKLFSSLTAVILAVTLSLSGIVSSAAGTDTEFTDVSTEKWSHDYISRVAEAGIMGGVSDGVFAPELKMTRAMFVTALAGFSGEDISGYGGDIFDDVKPDDYFFNAVAWAYENGIAGGTSERIFSPDAPMARQDLVLMIYRYFESKGIDVEYTDGTLVSLFYDDYLVASYARDAFSWAVNYEIISGVSQACGAPKGTATREQVACIFCKLLDYDPENKLPVPESIHMVRFLNDDGTVIFRMRVADGGSAVYPLTAPYKENTKEYRYTFSGWTRYFDNITKDTDIYAVFKAHKRVYYTVKFCNYDGTLLQFSTVEQGYNAVYTGTTPQRPRDTYYEYTFSGWNASTSNIQGNTTFTAVYTLKIFGLNDIDNRYDYSESGRITINHSNFKMSDALCTRLFNALTNADGRVTGFYLMDLETGMSVGYNMNTPFHTASTAKLGMALYAYKQIAAGRASLSDRIVYQPWHYCDGSGVLINYASYGQSFTLSYLLHVMIYESDNIAYYMVHDYFGVSGYNEMLKSLGVTHLHTSTKTWGDLTPKELGLIWEEIYKFRFETWEGQQLFNELLNAKFNFIKQGLNYKYSNIAHKSGFNAKGYHDSSIVFADRPYIMVIMLSPPMVNNLGRLSKIANCLDQVMQEYTNWLG